MRLAMKNSKFNLMEKFRMFKNTVLLLLLLVSCRNQSQNISSSTSLPIITGAQQIEVYLPILKDKNIGIVANQTSIVTNENGNHIHLVDTLLGHQINIVKVYAPEHGFRGTADAGEHIKDGKDSQTGLPIISLYGSNKKPSPIQLQGIDLMIFDLQDVGARFYTYISTLHYVRRLVQKTIYLFYCLIALTLMEVLLMVQF